MCSSGVIRRVREAELARVSELFELGALTASKTDDSFIRRLNTIFARRRPNLEKDVPATLADAIEQNGDLKPHAELIVFGQWLLIDGAPGMAPTRGQQPDPKKVLKCVAAAMSAVDNRRRKEKLDMSKDGRASRQKEITKRDIARKWKELFEEELKPSDFDSRIRSMERILSHYFRHLKSGAAFVGGDQFNQSPEIHRVLTAITKARPSSQSARTNILVEPTPKHPARLEPFEIELGYQSAMHEDEHRTLQTGNSFTSRLRYIPKKAISKSSSGKMRADRDGKIVLEPKVDIRRDYQIEALIDRLVILVNTRSNIAGKNLHEAIKKKTGAKSRIHDLRDRKAPGGGWGAPFLEVDSSKTIGAPFAILIQDPTKHLVSDIVNAIKDGSGIVGPVSLHLIEIAVDFYPKAPDTPDEAVLLREQMVGLLQRHHWVRPSLLVDHYSGSPRHIDARQIHDDEGKLPKRESKTRYLFANRISHGKKEKAESDSALTKESIRNRILTKKPGFPLMLNSTLSKGGKFSPLLISVQNKITDQRNPDKSTFIPLPQDKRRARVEVTISGTEKMEKRGLTTIDDLGRISFRQLTKGLLGFKLGMIEPWQHLLIDAEEQMGTRGTYGLDLRQRALILENRQALKRNGRKLPRNKDREGLGLDDWPEMNDVIGEALDGLKRRWKGFSIR